MRTNRAARFESFCEHLTEWMIYTFVISYAFSKALIEISFTVALLSWLFCKIARREWPRLRTDASAVFLSVFFLLTIFSFFVSRSPIESIHGVGKTAQEILFFVMVFDLFHTKAKLRKLFSVGVVAVFLVLLDTLSQFAVGKDLIRQWPVSYVDTNVRLTGPFGDHGLLASYLMVWIPFLAAFFLDQTTLSLRQKILMGVLAGIAGFCFFHTHARGAWLGFALAVAFFGVIERRKWLLTALAIAVFGGLFVLPKNMIIHPDAEGKEQSLVERYFLWDRAVQVIKARPLLGTGINTYVKSYHEFDQTKNWRVKNYYVHNSYLHLAAEQGLPALFCFLAFLFLLFGKFFRAVLVTRDPDLRAFLRGAVTALVAFLLFAFIDTGFEPLQTGMLFWFLLGIGSAAAHAARRVQKVMR